MSGSEERERMAVDERQRHQLYNRAIEVLGEEEAEILMAHLPPGGYPNLATKQDIILLKHDLDSLGKELRLEVRADIESLGKEMHRLGRNQLIAFVTAVGILNGATFAALRFL